MDEMIRLFKVRMADDIADYVLPVLKSGYIGEGPKVKEFEEALKKRFQNNLVLATNSATSAEHLALHLLKNPITKKWISCAKLRTPSSIRRKFRKSSEERVPTYLMMILGIPSS